MAEPITMQQLMNASLDADSLEVLVNGDENTDVTARLGEVYPSAKKAIKEMFGNGGLAASPFTTYDSMTTDGSSTPVGSYALVTNDTDSIKNGYYLRGAGSWTYIAYNLAVQVRKNAYMLSGKISSITYNADGSCTLSHPELRLLFGAGRGFVKVAAATNKNIPSGTVYYVDITGARLGGTLTGVVSTYDMNSLQNGFGSFVEDLKIPLLGLTGNATANTLVGWLLQNGLPETTPETIPASAYNKFGYMLAGKLTKASYDETADTYTISHPEMRILYGGGKSYNKIAAATNLVIPAKSMYYVDITGAAVGATLTGQVTPTDFASSAYGSGGFVEDLKIPLFGFLAGITGNRGLSVTGRLVQNGMPVASSVTNSPLNTVLVKKSSATKMDFYIKGTGENYLKHGFNRTQVAFDGGTTPNSQSDLWRIEGVWEVDSNLADVYNDAIVSTGEWECAMRETGAGVDTSDAIGGYHGDELQTNSFFVLDGKRVEQSSVFTKSVKELQFVQESIIYRCNTETPLCKHVKRYRITAKGGIELTQDFEWLRAATISRAWLAMLPIKRLINTTSGAQITDHATRYPNYSLENIAVDGFTKINTDVKEGDSVIIWGDTSNISAEVIFDVVPTTQAQMYIDNTTAYNKIYLDVTGNTSEVNVSIGDKWLSKTTFKLNTAN